MKNFKQKADNATVFASIWTIVFGILIWYYINTQTVLSLFALLFSFIKIVYYSYNAGCYTTATKIFKFYETEKETRKGRLHDVSSNESTNKD